MGKIKKNNIVTFPNNLSESEREIEAIIFSAVEPLDIETIEKRVQTNVKNRQNYGLLFGIKILSLMVGKRPTIATKYMRGKRKHLKRM